MEIIAWLFFHIQGLSKNMDISEERGRTDHGYNVGMTSNKAFHYNANIRYSNITVIEKYGCNHVDLEEFEP